MAEPLTSNLPLSLDTVLTLFGDAVALYSTSLNAPVGSGDLSFPTPSTIAGINFPCYLRVDNEIVYVTGAVGQNFTVDTRGASGTTAAAHSSGAIIYAVYGPNYNNQTKRSILALELANQVFQVSINFGNAPTFEKVFTITDANVLATSNVIAFQSGMAASGKTADENEMDKLILACLPAAGSFTLYTKAIPGPVYGNFLINYQIH